MLDASAIAAFFDGHLHLDSIKLTDWDKNGDGIIDAMDCPYIHGTTGAKVWWAKVFRPYCESQITPEMKTQYGSKVVGVFDGHPLVPGERGTQAEPQGDFAYLAMKIKVTEGFTLDAAKRIATHAMKLRYGEK
jgi:hypothetical protein